MLAKIGRITEFLCKLAPSNIWFKSIFTTKYKKKVQPQTKINISLPWFGTINEIFNYQKYFC